MTIGISSPIDISTFSSYFSTEEEQKWLHAHCELNWAPAVITLCHSYLKAGHKLRIFTLADEDKILVSKCQCIEIHTISACNRYPDKYLWGVFINYKRLKKEICNNLTGLDVIHAHWTYDFALAAAAQSSVPVYCTVRDWTPYIFQMVSTKDKFTWSFRWLINELVFRKQNITFIGNSPYTSALIAKKLHKPIATIPNSVKDSFIPHEEHVPTRSLRILCITSGNDKRKNVINLIKAYQIIKSKHEDAILTIVGPGFENTHPIAGKWYADGLMNGVICTGSVAHDKLPDYLENSSMLVIPSLEETFGNTLLEGYAHSIPVIGGEASGAVPYVLKHGELGYLCDVTKPFKIADMIFYVYQHWDEAVKKAHYAHLMLLKEYSESVVAERYIQQFTKSNS